MPRPTIGGPERERAFEEFLGAPLADHGRPEDIKRDIVERIGPRLRPAGGLRCAIVSHRKDMEAVIAEAERQGWRVAKGKGHYKLYAPDGENIVTASATPGSASSVRHTIANLRRFGFDWKGR